MKLKEPGSGDLLRAQRPTLVPWFILIDHRRNMGDILDVSVSAAAICNWQGHRNISGSCQSGHSVWYFCLHTHWTCSSVKTNAATHCQRTARTPSDVAPGWARPCACRLEDTPPQSGFHQSAERSEMRKPIAEGERWDPSLQPQTSLKKEFSTLDSSSLTWVTPQDNAHTI